MDNQTAITLKPKLGYWVSKYFVIIVVASLLPVLCYLLGLQNACTLCVNGAVFSRLDYVVLHIWARCLLQSGLLLRIELIFRHGIISRREEHLEVLN